MFRLLIVDDVSIIVDSLGELFEENETLEVEVFKAYSAVEALGCLRQTKIDIVLTDIKMPEMTGLELLKEVRMQWPRCKVIFLTSFSDFEYAKEAIASGGFDYILKTDGDDPILEAVERAAASLQEEAMTENLLIRTQQQLKAAVPVLQKELITDIVHGKSMLPGQMMAAFQEVNFPLDQHLEVLPLIARVDEWRESMSPSDKALLIYALQNIVEEYLTDSAHLFALHFEKTKIVWLLQPKLESDHQQQQWENLFRFVFGTLETIQNSCKELLGLPVSFIAGRYPVSWQDLSVQVHHMRSRLGWGLGLHREMLMTDEQLDYYSEASGNSMNAAGREFRFDHLSELYYDLENNQRELFFARLEQLMNAVSTGPAVAQNQYIVYHALCSIFLTYSDRYCIDLDVLAPDPESWQEIVAFFSTAAHRIFDGKSAEQSGQTQAVVMKINQYIVRNLNGDNSLIRLGEYVNLNPSYLSRLYKEATGKALSDYIAEIRIQAAVRLLRDKELKIGEIATEIGYQSSLAFYRFFKNKMNMTPQEYRQSLNLPPV
ncbi:response regulator transcription factor [Cohnella silvisoli]|uniref:Response regulator n=1 Tax=Cohnella silvisoli TaxID=2873699 RepID=A0ABV1KRW4_9BACL|nr:response regulator [Cohnella silvisoli]MCD9022453.1 response regulator [Cohnella silvisoli]